jgi:hypothetical protein
MDTASKMDFGREPNERDAYREVNNTIAHHVAQLRLFSPTRMRQHDERRHEHQYCTFAKPTNGDQRNESNPKLVEAALAAGGDAGSSFPPSSGRKQYYEN